MILTITLIFGTFWIKILIIWYALKSFNIKPCSPFPHYNFCLIKKMTISIQISFLNFSIFQKFIFLIKILWGKKCFLNILLYKKGYIGHKFEIAAVLLQSRWGMLFFFLKFTKNTMNITRNEFKKPIFFFNTASSGLLKIVWCLWGLRWLNSLLTHSLSLINLVVVMFIFFHIPA